MLTHATARMVEEQLSGVYAAADERVLHPSRFTRVIAAARTGQLNAALAAGADPSGCAQLAAHAAMLSSPRVRAAIADELDQLTAADAGGRWRVRPNRRAMFASAATIKAISILLLETTPVYARGIAMLSELLRDGTGPLYAGNARALSAFLEDALNVMRTGQPGGGSDAARIAF